MAAAAQWPTLAMIKTFVSGVATVFTKMGFAGNDDSTTPDPAATSLGSNEGEEQDTGCTDSTTSHDGCSNVEPTLQNTVAGQGHSKHLSRSSGNITSTPAPTVANTPQSAVMAVVDDIEQGPKKASRDRRRSSVIHLKEENAMLRQAMEDWRHDANQWEQNAVHHRMHHDAVRVEYERIRGELNEARRHEATLLEEVTHLKTLLEDRRQELKDAQRFMGTMDTFAESDVVREVHSLNTEIFNLARSIADNASQHSPTQIQASERDAAETTIHILGRHFATMLESTDTRGDTILLEIAIQVVVTGFLYEVVSAWTIGHDGNGILASVYGRIRAYENQSVAGQWRALTRKFAQDKHINPAQMEEILTRDLAALLQHVMTLSRMSLSTRHNPQPSLHTLIGKALKIRHLVGEAMKSSEYEALLPQPEAAFVPGEMEDAYAPRGAGRRAGLSVMCCVSLGLRRVEKSEEGLRSVTLIKSEVGLQTLLEDLGVAGEDDEDMSA